MKKQINESGYTLIESIMYIGIICMLGISIVSLINTMLDKYRMSRITQQIKDLQKNIDFRFSAAENYKLLSNSDLSLLIEERIIPGDMISDNDLYHAYNGEVEITSNMDDSAYDITFYDLPYTTCVELAMIDWVNGHNSHLLHIKVNDTYFTWQGKNAQKLPMLYSQAIETCQMDNENEITWRFQ